MMKSYEDKDPLKWEIQFYERMFKQWWAFDENSPIMWVKCRVKLEISPEDYCNISSFENRPSWDLQFKKI